MLHAVQVLASSEQADDPETVPTPSGEYPEVLTARVQKNVLNQFSQVLEKQATPIDVIQSLDGNNYVKGVYRFLDENDKEEILDAFEEGVISDAKYWKIEYHECTHDPETGVGRGACPDWEVERSNGDVPDWL